MKYHLRNGAIVGPNEMYISAYTSKERHRLVAELNRLDSELEALKSPPKPDTQLSEADYLREALQEIADCCITESLRARDKVSEISRILERYSGPVPISDQCVSRPKICVAAMPDGEYVTGLGLGVEDNPFVDTITERELAFALNCMNIDGQTQTPDYSLANMLFAKVLENRGKHPSLMDSYMEQNSDVHCTAHVDYDPDSRVNEDAGNPKLSAASVFQYGSSCQILDYLSSLIKDTVLSCALKHGAQPVATNELSLWSEQSIRDLVRNEIKDQLKPGGMLS